MTKFTPGPYRINAEPSWFGFEARFFTVTNSEGLIVAFCKDWMDGPEPEANAKLFSAAPELLAALVAIVSKARKQNWNDNYPVELQAAVDAIAKATA